MVSCLKSSAVAHLTWTYLSRLRRGGPTEDVVAKLNEIGASLPESRRFSVKHDPVHPAGLLVVAANPARLFLALKYAAKNKEGMRAK